MFSTLAARSLASAEAQATRYLEGQEPEAFGQAVHRALVQVRGAEVRQGVRRLAGALYGIGDLSRSRDPAHQAALRNARRFAENMSPREFVAYGTNIPGVRAALAAYLYLGGQSFQPQNLIPGWDGGVFSPDVIPELYR